MPNWYNIRAAKKPKEYAKVSIYDEIGAFGVSARDFIVAIGGLDNIELTIHSPGGSVTDGLAIYNAIAVHKGDVKVQVNVMAASMASVIALAGDEVEIADNGFFMVHNPWVLAVGDADEMERTAEEMRKFEDILANIYVERTNLSENEVREMMRNETWIHAEDAVAKGFATRTFKPLKAAANWQSNLHEKFSKWPAVGVPSGKNLNKENTNMDNEQLLEMQAKITKAEASIATKDKEIDVLKGHVKAAQDELENMTKLARQDAAKIVALGKSHNQLDLAIKAIDEGKTVDEFRGQLLDAYASQNKPGSNESATFPGDPSVEPKSHEDFVATYTALKNKDSLKASQYLAKHGGKFR